MARPTTKIDLLQAANDNFTKLDALINSMSENMQNTAFDFADKFPQKEAHWKRDKNLRDVLIHLYEWHQLILNWVNSNQKGDSKPFIPEPYNWRTYGEMNVEFVAKHLTTSLEEAKTLLVNSHNQVMAQIESFSNEQLFAKNILVWTGKTPLGSYYVSSTASHYEWAIKKIKKHQKTYSKA